MRATLGLAVWLVTISQGAGKLCDGRREGAQCYGQLDGEIVIRLMDKAPFRYNWMKKTVTLLKWKNNTLKIELPERMSFTPTNGTLKNLKRNDSGNYTLYIFNQQGKEIENRTLQLFIQAPVTSVHLASKCQSPGGQPVSCSSKGGDSLQYKWSLNKKPLQDSDLLSGDVQANNITLKPYISGQLICFVRNDVSESQNEVTLSCVFINCTSNGTLISQWLPEMKKNLCDTPTPGAESPQSTNYLPLMGGILSALLILLMIGVAVVYKLKKKQSSVEDEEELTYADVRIVNQPRRSIKMREEVEVEYGQVKLPQRPRGTVAAKNDASIYAHVRKHR
ncbi:platelet-derived growth factor receptor alpha-like [Hippocampus zosterae]|uniref:platelet-derived growth factor receptor alpha-like n=1 Tax=Hippocampus zosterae TaxID=109293 RepID=UPI00223DC181|nr:platelet-derived growth factor receptor alpha-like [Hippocampus zosterae]